MKHGLLVFKHCFALHPGVKPVIGAWRQLPYLIDYLAHPVENGSAVNEPRKSVKAERHPPYCQADHERPASTAHI